MTITRALIAAVIFAAAGLGAAGPARADDVMAGIYAYDQPGLPPSTWTIYPMCVIAGCVLHISDSTPGRGAMSDTPPYSGDARLVNDQWTLGVNLPTGISCPDGSTAALSRLYRFDDKTLTGTVTILHGAVCGMQAAQIRRPFTLAYQSPLPIPVEQYPGGYCPTFPRCDYNSVIPGTISPGPVSP